jgi:hypothetical protein
MAESHSDDLAVMTARLAALGVPATPPATAASAWTIGFTVGFFSAAGHYGPQPSIEELTETAYVASLTLQSILKKKKASNNDAP